MKRLSRLERRTRTRLATFRETAATLPLLDHQAADVLASFLAAETANVWAEFTRSYFSFALATAVSVTGQRIRTRFPSGTPIAVALAQIPQVLRHQTPTPMRRDEPVWHSRREFLKTITLAGLTNRAQIVAALSLPSRVIEHLPTVRNFYAHRNDETVAKVRGIALRYALPTIHHPTDFMRARISGRPATIFEEWIAELDAVVAAMCA